MAGLAIIDDGDVGDADALEFGKIANHGDGFNVEFLMHHEVVALLDKIVSKREDNNEDTSRLRNALDFCKDQSRCTDLGDDALNQFCHSVREHLQQMVDVHGEDGGDDNHRLHPFEIAALVNLIDCELAEDPHDPASQLEECHAVIPSLKRFTDDFLVKDVLPTLKREREELQLGASNDDGEKGDEGSDGGFGGGGDGSDGGFNPNSDYNPNTEDSNGVGFGFDANNQNENNDDNRTLPVVSSGGIDMVNETQTQNWMNEDDGKPSEVPVKEDTDMNE